MKNQTVSTALNYRRLTDEELAYRFTNRKDAEALSQLHKRYAHLVLGNALLHFHSIEKATEMTRLLFLSLFETLPHRAVPNFKKWLETYTISFFNSKKGIAKSELVAGDFLFENPTLSNSYEDARTSSSCITKRQLLQAATDDLIEEENAALQIHTAGCAFCAKALKGIKGNEAQIPQLLHDLNTAFLTDHHQLLNPKIHQNSLVVTSSKPAKRHRSKSRRHNGIRPSYIATLIVMSFGILWYVEYGKKVENKTTQTPVENTRQQIITPQQATAKSETETPSAQPTLTEKPTTENYQKLQATKKTSVNTAKPNPEIPKENLSHTPPKTSEEAKPKAVIIASLNETQQQGESITQVNENEAAIY